MNNDNHNLYGPNGPEIEATLLIEYLIEKSEELSQGNYRGVPLSFRVLGVAVLQPLPELRKEFLEITSRSGDPMNERAKRCKDIFIDALGRPQDGDSYDSSDECPELGSSGRVIASRFCWAARRLGREMLGRKDFRFLPIWMCISYVGLSRDSEKLREFEEKCRLYRDPEERIEQMNPILWEVVRSKMRRN